ncbi:hypothetical protein BURPS305_4875 [Burkholderia pseudomallei 305]|uniref:Uncharacterized protein n=1 Tax=Burkholderia mallei (strain NCTC 10229) TaxID=412022 RepID=A2S600_BURM9|nr:hypothetical protein BMA10229_A1386 [Burkholderia mallei NCTC 10229]EBA48730.1 hypothetical protein BURPS305_4875 [Burkholderia pseudomallei 305]EDK59738.1 hypothetical protein BMAJHU_B0682 [Burkholderia mallei JHU]EDO91251.1 hypothetical protein BURPSPAST_Z0476 [Burkholderia pseudomallei Pasteur 52237]EDP86249.1 hypothetical protein BMA10399_D0887 [Burkholderia mallei ATCC 10399]EDS85593.1 hypothetical protein BURPSS13_I0672 [Burkholderia pseudomallei S13]
MGRAARIVGEPGAERVGGGRAAGDARRRSMCAAIAPRRVAGATRRFIRA